MKQEQVLQKQSIFSIFGVSLNQILDKYQLYVLHPSGTYIFKLFFMFICFCVHLCACMYDDIHSYVYMCMWRLKANCQMPSLIVLHLIIYLCFSATRD